MKINLRLDKLENSLPERLPIPILIKKIGDKYYDLWGNVINYPRKNMREKPIIMDQD
jgi:hypothetical protein